MAKFDLGAFASDDMDEEIFVFAPAKEKKAGAKKEKVLPVARPDPPPYHIPAGGMVQLPTAELIVPDLLSETSHRIDMASMFARLFVQALNDEVLKETYERALVWAKENINSKEVRDFRLNQIDRYRASARARINHQKIKINSKTYRSKIAGE